MQEHSQTEPSTHGTRANEAAVSSATSDATTGERMFECACHDGNYGLEAILRGTREQEKQST